MKLKLLSLLLAFSASLLFPAWSFASGNLSIRLGQPKTPTNQNNLKLTFVSLQIGGTENIAVDCYKKTPSDADFVKFENLLLIPGGNTDYCTVDSNIMNVDGTYSFKVSATVGAETVWSTVSTVEYNSKSPDSPVFYAKEKISSCEYKIRYKTANDGRTAKVELFRSDSGSISIDSGSRVLVENVGPDQEGSFVVGAPDCNREYYFAIRAVDNSDNASSLTGDNFTKITFVGGSSVSGGTTQEAIPVGSGSQVSAGTVGEAEAGQTDGTTPSTAPSEETTAEQTTPEPEVLGIKTSNLANLKWLAIPLLLGAVFFFLRAKKHS